MNIRISAVMISIAGHEVRFDLRELRSGFHCSVTFPGNDDFTAEYNGLTCQTAIEGCVNVLSAELGESLPEWAAEWKELS